MSKFAVVVLTFAFVPCAFAQSPLPRETARFGAQRPAQPTNPFGGIDPKWLEKAARALAEKNASTKPYVVCGMTIVPGDPQMDSKMAVGRTRNDVRYTLRNIDPPVCKP